MKDFLKKLIPTVIWKNARDAWYGIVHVVQSIGPKIRSRSYCGFRLYYNSGNSIMQRLRSEPIFEDEMCKAIVSDLMKKNQQVFLDIGANIGFISLYVASKIPSARIFTFEPGPKQSTLLKKTIEANDLGGSIIQNDEALSDSNGKQTFYTHPRRDMSKDGLMDTGRGEKTVSIQVQTLTLDTWWNKAGRPKIGAVKIDTEGAELLILRGAKQFLSEIKPVIYLEISVSNLKAYPYKAKDILEYLNVVGYSVSTLSRELVTANNLESVLIGNETFRASPLILS